MSATKAPIYLKRGSRRGKKEKLRDILSSDMISPPLGDFRHTIHIGSGGESDTFGDISFLQGKFHLLPRSESSLAPGGGAPYEFSRTASISGRGAPPSDLPSPLLKNAISLPVIGGLQALTLPLAQAAPPKPPRLHLEDHAPAAPGRAGDPGGEGGRTLAAGAPRGTEAPPNGLGVGAGEEEEAAMTHAGSLLSLHMDLGPSILDDVLQVMERHRAGADRAPFQDPGRQQIST